jgi:hypothetical protein
MHHAPLPINRVTQEIRKGYSRNAAPSRPKVWEYNGPDYTFFEIGGNPFGWFFPTFTGSITHYSVIVGCFAV